MQCEESSSLLETSTSIVLSWQTGVSLVCQFFLRPFRPMRLFLLGLFAAVAFAADWSLYVCAATTKNYVVGAKLLPSGLFSRHGDANWKLQGHANPFTFALDYDPRD